MMELQIHTQDRRLIFDLVGSTEPSSGHEIELSPDVRLVYEGSYIRKAAHVPEILIFSTQFAASVGAGVLANWLYTRLSGKKIEKIVIDTSEVKLDEGEINRVLHERIEVERR